MSTSDVHRPSGAVARGASPQSSASGLSSPPRSSPDAASPSAQMMGTTASHDSTPGASVLLSQNEVPGVVVGVSAEKPPRKKPGRKPGQGKPRSGADSAAANTSTDAPKIKRVRKPRDPNAPIIPRRKRKADPDGSALKNQLGGEAMTAGPSQTHVPAPVPAGFVVPSSAATLASSQIGNNEDIHRPPLSFFGTAPPPLPSQPHPSSQPPSQAPAPSQPPAVRTSGQNYDPIRSSSNSYDPVRETVVSHSPYGNPQSSPNHLQQQMNRASASPSISSLVDPPNQALTSPSIAAQSFFNQQQHARLFREEPHNPVPSSNGNALVPPVAPESSPKISSNPAPPPVIAKKPDSSAAPAPGLSTISKKNGHASTANSSAAASPKPVKTKEPKNKNHELDLYPAPPPLPGSGLTGGDGTEFRAPTVILNIPMNGQVNKYVNFTQLAEKQYGWDALHPRLAAQRDRLARVAAAGAALERNGSSKDSGDEMSLDSGDEGSNVEMGGMSDGRTGTDGGVKKKPQKRKMKEDEYDKDDGFVDDSELLWEEQAAAANDGFFVYSGPLVPEGEKPHLDSRDAAPKRGRGRGRGGVGRGAGTRGGGATGLNTRTGLPLSGPGSRGGSTTRKPRITKADRARMEAEKIERERMGTMATVPSNYGSPAQYQSGPNMGTTPMVFNQ